MKKSKTFPKKILTSIFIVIISLASFYLITNYSNHSKVWKTYTNEDYNFSLKYPSSWNIEESFANNEESGVILRLRSSNTAKLLKQNKIDYGYSYDLEISYWPNMNNFFARGGSWKKQCSSLADYFLLDEYISKEKMGETIISEITAYEVSIGGSGLNYGVMIENDGIYELSFETAWDKSRLGADAKEVLSSFHFIK